MSRKLLCYLIIFVVLSLACAGLGQPTPDPGGSVPTAPPPPTATLPSATRPPTPSGSETVTVAQVVDGDTIELTNGRKVRYIGINTPERDQPYYAEATAVNRQLVQGKNVQLELDVETFDRYGRTLAYVWVDGVMVNLEIVRQGYAKPIPCRPIRVDQLGRLGHCPPPTAAWLDKNVS